ncbi:MAG: hypothetical protein U0821_03310 [Chloroflexota bacterium]
MGRHAVVLGLTVAVLLAFGIGTGRAQTDSCEATSQPARFTCQLDASGTGGGQIGPGSIAEFPFAVAGFQSPLKATVTAARAGVKAQLRDLTAAPIAEAVVETDGGAVTLESVAPTPGLYWVTVSRDPGLGDEEERAYTLNVVAPSEAGGQIVALSSLIMPTLDGHPGTRHWSVRLTTPRGGSPDAGLAVARALPIPPDTTVGDFVLAADAMLDECGGQCALTVRFRYRPEAGGGSGYVLYVDPWAGQVRLATFEDGKQISLIPWTAEPVAKFGQTRTRVVAAATGDAIRVYIAGKLIASAQHAGFNDGMLAVGTTTWAGPATATFEDIVLTAPPSRLTERLRQS